VTPVTVRRRFPLYYGVMPNEYVLFPDLAKEADVPANGILSRTLYQDDHVKVILFGFAEGQELSAHTAPFKASVHILEGKAKLTLGSETMDAGAGTWVMMEPKLEHGVKALTEVKMLLTMQKKARAD
jgi:quercetin dioxygenase-like cupin family protein